MELIRTHDALFKFVFGEPDQMAELLRARLPKAVAAAIDWSTLTRVPGSFVDRALQGRSTDLLFTARMGRATVLLYVVAEHKSDDDRWTTWQVTAYVVRILEQWRRENSDAGNLPIVLPFVLYHGERPWRSPSSPHELVDWRGCPTEVTEWLGGHQLRLPFVLFDLARLDEDQVDAMRLSAVSGLTLRFLQFLRTCPRGEAITLLRRWMPILAGLLTHTRGREVLFALLSWYIASNRADHEALHTVMTEIRQEVPPMRTALDLLIEMNEATGEARGIHLGIQQGLHHGLQQGLQSLRTMLTGLLRQRFGEVSDDVLERILAADAETLQTWALRVFGAATPAEVVAP